MIWTDQYGLYDGSWKGLIVDEAFAHPAKFARGLIEWIIEHGLERGYWRKGSLIGDPFAGICTGGIIAASNGLRWAGVELEPKFVELAEQNFALHRRTWEGFGDPLPVIVQGDSREFARIVGECGAVVTSPPYQQGVGHGGGENEAPGKGDERYYRSVIDGYGQTPGQIGSLPAGRVEGVITSPPYADGGQGFGSDPHPEKAAGMKNSEAAAKSANAFRGGYGDTPGQIGSLKAGELDAAITSPPYAETVKGDHGETETAQDSRDKRQTPGGSLGQSQRHGGYGVSEGNIGNLKEGEVDAVVTSPPWEKVIPTDGRGMDLKIHKQLEEKYGRKYTERSFPKDTYGETEGQIGRESAKTYWQACAAVYRQVHLALKPGGIAAIVCKDYVKNKQRVPLCDDTCRLLESLGFEVFERTRCWLVKETRHPDLFGGEDHVERTERKSFFRRLAEAKGSPRIDWEEVIWARRKGSEVGT